MRFLKFSAQDFGIDTSKVFLVGSSAGAIAVLQHLYWDKNTELSPDVFEVPSLGELDAVGLQGYSSKPAGVTSLWGAIQDPEIIENEDTPIFMVHGTDDDIVPFKMGVPLAGSVPDIPNVSFTMPPTYGSFCIDTALNNRGIEHDTYFVEGKKHEFYGVDTGKFYEDGPNQYWDTIHTKMTEFFLKQFRPKADFGAEISDFTVHFTNTTDAAISAEWDFDDGHRGTGDRVSHSYSEAGIYPVRLSTCNANLACDTLTKSIVVGSSHTVSDLLEKNFSVFPNPVSRELNISGIHQPFEVNIYDVSGRKQIVLKKVANAKIDVSQLQNGVYFLEINTGTLSVIRKIVKVNK